MSFTQQSKFKMGMPRRRRLRVSVLMAAAALTALSDGSSHVSANPIGSAQHLSFGISSFLAPSAPSAPSSSSASSVSSSSLASLSSSAAPSMAFANHSTNRPRTLPGKSSKIAVPNGGNDSCSSCGRWQMRQRTRIRPCNYFIDSTPTSLFSTSSTALSASVTSPTSPTSLVSLISPSNHYGNIAILAFTASLAQLLGKTTLVGKLLGAPVTAMALTFVLSSVGLVPNVPNFENAPNVPNVPNFENVPNLPNLPNVLNFDTWNPSTWRTLLPPGGSTAASFLQRTSLTLATPLLLLGTSLKGAALRQCGSLLGSFVIASFGTLLGSVLALSSFSLPSIPLLSSLASFGGINSIKTALLAALPHDGIKIAAALLAKNIGGGINYMAVCSCLNASPESVAAGLCVDNVMALVYFPLVSVLAGRYGDLKENGLEENDLKEENEVEQSFESGIVETTLEEDGKDGKGGKGSIDVNGSEASPIEALSHAFTLATVLTSLGQFLNSKLHLLITALNGANGSSSGSKPLNLSLPITTLLTVLFSTYYPPNWFLSPSSSEKASREPPSASSEKGTSNNVTSNSTPNATSNSTPNPTPNAIAHTAQTLGTSLLYLFFATAGAPGWRLNNSKHSIQSSFLPIASFLVVLYGVHGLVLWGAMGLVEWVDAFVNRDNGANGDYTQGKAKSKSFWKKIVAPQRLLTASSAAIGGPATAAALAQSHQWESLLTPSLLVGNVGYAVATFIGLAFYGVFR